METDENRRGKEKEAAALSGGHLCHVCGYQYPNPHPSAKLRRSHRKHCGKAPPVVEEEVAAVGRRASEREERNAREGTLLAGNGGEVKGKSEANGGAALHGSAREVGESEEDKAVAEHASSNGAGVHHVNRELNENGQINCITTEKASPDVKVVNSELSKNGLFNCSSNSEFVNQGNGAQLPIASNNGSQNEVAKHCSELAPTTVTNPAEREDSFDEYQDASPFLHQSDLEDGALPSSELVEINNLNNVLSGSSAAANEISLGRNGLCNEHVFGELNLNDSKVENDSDNGTLSLAEPGVSLKLEVPYESYKNVDNNHTDMVDNEPHKRVHHSEPIGDPDVSSLHVQETHSVVLNANSQSTCSRKMHVVMEDTMHASHNMYEASPTPEAAETSNALLETLTGSSSNSMSIGNELLVVHSENNPIDSSTELPTQNWPVKDTSDVQLPVENLYQKKICSTVGFQDNLPTTSYVDDAQNPITKDSCSDMNFTFEAMTQQDVVKQVNVPEENPSVQKRFTEDEVCNKQTDPGVPTDQFLKSQKRAVLPMSKTSCAKNPFDLDDDRNDDLFELPTNSCYLEAPTAVSRQEVDSASLILDQPSVSNQTRMAEAQHSHNPNDASSYSENSHPNDPKDMLDSTCAELVINTRLADAQLNHHLQEHEAHTNGISFAPYQVAPMEFHTICTQDTSALSTGTEENTQTKEVAVEEMTVVRTTDDIEMKQADDSTATDTYAINVEAKKVTDDTASKMNGVQHYNVEEKHTDGTKEVSVLQSMSNREENKLTEDPNTKEMNADDLEGKWQVDGTNAEKMDAILCTDNFEEMFAQATRAKEVVALQCTEAVDENKQRNAIVDKEGDNKNEGIAVTGGRLDSGRIRAPLKVLLAEASAENKVNKPSAKERVLSFGRRVSKNDNLSAKSGPPKSGCDDHSWDSPAKLPRKDTDNSSKGRKQPWMPFICCHSVR